MNSQFAQFIPPFLRKLDQRWLVERPTLWASRIHYVLFFGSVGILLAYVMGQTYQIYYPSPPNMQERFTFASLPVLIGLVFWVYQMRKFLKPAKTQISASDSAWKNTSLFIVGVLFLALIPTTYVLSLNNKLQKTYTERTYVKDLQSASIGFFWDADLGKHYMKDTPGLEWMELRTYRDQLITREEWLMASEETQGIWLKNFRKVYNKYSMEPLAIEDEKLMALFTCEAGKRPYAYRSRPVDCLHSDSFSASWVRNQSDFRELQHNLRDFAEVNIYPLGERMVFPILIFWGLMLAFMVHIWQNSPTKEFFVALAIYTSLGLITVFVVNHTTSLLELGDSANIYLSTVVLLVLHRLAVRISLYSQRKESIRKGALILATMAVPLIVLMLFVSFREMDAITFPDRSETTFSILSTLGAVVGFYIWARYYGPRMTTIITQPAKK